MVMISQITSGLVTKEKKFTSQKIHARAQQDVAYLASSANVQAKISRDYLRLEKEEEVGGYVLALGAKVQDQCFSVPASYVYDEPDHYIGVVMYDEDMQAEGVFLHSNAKVLKCAGPWKYNKKTDEYTLNTKKYKNWDKLKFGFVFSKFIK